MGLMGSMNNISVDKTSALHKLTSLYLDGSINGINVHRLKFALSEFPHFRNKIKSITFLIKTRSFVSRASFSFSFPFLVFRSFAFLNSQ